MPHNQPMIHALLLAAAVSLSPTQIAAMLGSAEKAFKDDARVGGAIESAMQFLAGTDALIIDLRHNGGGSPRAAQTLEAYFFSQQQQITSIEFRDPTTGKLTEYQQYTASTVPGPLYLNKPIYLLTSAHTGSCAEQFAYDLHNLKRVTLVGQTTIGAANPGGFHPIGGKFAIFIPVGRAYSPVTKTNWEGTGIAPYVASIGTNALVRAYTLALQDAKKREKQPELADAITRALALSVTAPTADRLPTLRSIVL